MNQENIRPLCFDPIYRRLSSMRRAVIDNPEDTLGFPVGGLLHNQVNQASKAFDPVALAAQPKELGAPNVPGCHVSQGSFPFVFVFNTAVAPRSARCSGCNASASLNTGFLIGRNNEIPVAQGFAVPCAMIQVQDSTCFPFEIRVPRPYPASITPRADSILSQPSPDGGATDRSCDAATHGLPSNFLAGETGKWKPEISGELTGQRLYFHDDFRGKNRRGVHAVAVPASRPGVVQRIVCATSRQSAVAHQVARRSPCSAVPRRQGG